MTIGVTGAEHILHAQDQSLRPKIAVLRLKSSQQDPQRRYIVNDLSPNLAGAMRATGKFEMPDDAAVQKALQEEGLKAEGLLVREKCLDVGKVLGVDYVVAGSALLEGLTWSASVRVFSVKNQALVATADASYSINQMNVLYGVLASRISEALANPPDYKAAWKNFAWKGEQLMTFGRHRVDLEPPILVANNAEPPFELSVVADMSAAGGSHAVANFEVFVDDMSLGTIHGRLAPPVTVKERTWAIGGCAYVFTLELKEMRVFTPRGGEEETNFVTSAKILITARPAN
jgi:TolB-like protein